MLKVIVKLWKEANIFKIQYLNNKLRPKKTGGQSSFWEKLNEYEDKHKSWTSALK